MKNKALDARLDGLVGVLQAMRAAGGASATANRGVEREAFVRGFLDQVVPPAFRIGTGEIVDRDDNRTGQIDIVVEYPFFPSLGGLPGQVRAYLAEAVSSIIEVKSDVAKQWTEVESTLRKVRRIRRGFDAIPTLAGQPNSRRATAPGSEFYDLILQSEHKDFDYTRVPTFAVGYSGWSTLGTLRKMVNDHGLYGLLVIDEQLYCGISRGRLVQAKGCCSLWAFICAVTETARVLLHSSFDPLAYSSRRAPS